VASELRELKESLLKHRSCNAHPPIRRTVDPEEAALFHESFQHCSDGMRIDHLRWLARNDLFYLGVYILHRWHWIGASGEQKTFSPEQKQKIAKWYHARCWEVQDAPNNHLDVWAREHGKSEILSFALIIQDILKDSNSTVGIFASTSPLAKQFLRLIKVEFETNEELKDLFPDILWRNPKRDSPKWAENDGITVRRQSNRKEATVEAWGLVDGQPTSKRFTILHYDDVVARDQISEDMTFKTKQELQNSFALTASDPMIARIIGTPQEIGDVMCQLMDEKKFPLRWHPAATANGTPVFFSESKLADFKDKMSPKVFALQFLLDPKAAQDAHAIGFLSEWWKTYPGPLSTNSLNLYVMVDPAGRGVESNTLYALWVVGCGADRKWRIIDGVLDNLDLGQRTDMLFGIMRKYPRVLKVIYEQQSLQSDIEHIREIQMRENFIFQIQAVTGIRRKDDRIERLIPKFRSGDVLVPERLMYKNRDGLDLDIIKRFKDVEYSKWPFNPGARDQLDALARICDESEINFVYPIAYGQGRSVDQPWGAEGARIAGSWLSE
jgi:hypothetical protein